MSRSKIKVHFTKQDPIVLSKIYCLFNGTNENKKNEKTRVLKNFKKKLDKLRSQAFKLKEQWA